MIERFPPTVKVCVIALLVMGGIVLGLDFKAGALAEDGSSLIVSMSWRGDQILVFQNSGQFTRCSAIDGQIRQVDRKDLGRGYSTLATWSVNGLLAAAQLDGTVMVWQPDWEAPQAWKPQIQELICMEWSAKDVLALGANDGKVQLWDQRKNRTTPAFDWQPRGGGISSISWKPTQDRLAIANDAGDLVEFDPEVNRVSRLRGHDPNGGLAGVWAYWDPTGVRLAVFSRGDLRLHFWHEGEYSPRHNPTGAFDGAAAWRPDGTGIAYTSANAFWYRSIGKSAARQLIPGQCPTALAWNPTGDTLAVGFADGTLKTISPASGLVLHELKLP